MRIQLLGIAPGKRFLARNGLIVTITREIPVHINAWERWMGKIEGDWREFWWGEFGNYWYYTDHMFDLIAELTEDDIGCV